jgi:hypothetical protein
MRDIISRIRINENTGVPLRSITKARIVAADPKVPRQLRNFYEV